MSNQPTGSDWDDRARLLIGIAEEAEARARANYREVAIIIDGAIKQLGITQKAAATAVGKSTTWISRLLNWRRRGFPEGSIFEGQRSRRPKRIEHCWWSSVGHVPTAGRDEHADQLELRLR